MAQKTAKSLTVKDILQAANTVSNNKNKKWQDVLADITTDTADGKWYQGWIKGGGLLDGLTVGNLLRTYAGTYQDVQKTGIKAVLDATENLIDTGGITVATVGSLLGKDWGNQAAQWVAKDLLQSEKTADWAFNHLPTDLATYGLTNAIFPKITGENYEQYSLLGEKADSMLESFAHQAGARGLQAAGVPWQIPAAVNAFVPEYENAINSGANHWEALVSGATSAGVEVGSEMLFAASGMLDEVGLINLDKLTSGIKNKALKALADFGVDIAAEGVEEVASEFGSILGSLVYEAEDPSQIWEVIQDKVTWNNMLTAFISGGIMAGFGNAGNVVNSVANQTDYRTGLTASEQSVFDAAYAENAKAYEDANGKKPTGKAKSEVYTKTMDQLLKGYISTDTVGKTLSANTYDQLQQVNAQIEKLQPEYDQLYNMKSGEKTDAQVDRQKDLHQQLSDLKQQREALDVKLESAAKGTRMEESYRERSRRGQAFQADPAQYENEAAQQTVKNIIDSGVVNNTNRTHEFVGMLAKLSSDTGLVFSSTDAKRLKDTGYVIDDAIVNGRFTENGIEFNINSAKALNTVVGHEVVHAMEGSQLYDALAKAAVSFAKTKGEYKSRLAALKKLYNGKKGYEADFDAKVQKELVADLVGDYLFTDEQFVRNLAATDRNLFQRIWDEVKYLAKIATKGSKEARQLEKIKKTFSEAYRDIKNTAQQPDGVKYDISADSVIDLSKDNVLAERLSGVYGAQRYKEIQKYILEALGEQPITLSDGKQAIVDNRDALHIANKAADKKTAEISHIRDLVENAQLYAEDRNVQHNKFKYFCYYVANVKYGDETFPIYLNVGLAINDNAYHLYDITNRIRDTADRINGLERPKPKEGYALTNGVSTYSLSENDQNVNNESANDAAGWNISGADVALQQAEQNTNADVQQQLHQLQEEFNAAVAAQDEAEIMRISQEMYALENPGYDPAAQDHSSDRAATFQITLTQKAMSDLAKEIKTSLGVPRKRTYEVYALINDYLTGKISGRDQLYNQLKDKFGSINETIVNDDIKQVKDYLRSYRIQVSDDIKQGIADYKDIVKRNRGKIVFSSQGTPVDMAYQKMSTEFPGFFPDNIYSPEDQFLRILSIANESSTIENVTQIDDQTLWDVSGDIVEYIDDVGEVSNAHPVAEMSEILEILDEEPVYISKLAEEYLEELENTQKGKRYPPFLSAIINDLPNNKGRYSSLKIALKNIRDNPEGIVNPNSKAETVARKYMSEAYKEAYTELEQAQISANKPDSIKTAKDRMLAKIYFTERARIKAIKNRQRQYDGYNRDIAEMKDRYNNIKDKNTVSAYKLLQSISNKEKLRDENYADYEKKINDLSERIIRLGSEEYKASAQRQLKHDQYYRWAEDLLGDTSKWKDKKHGMGYMTNTLRRNLRSVVKDENGNPDYARADRIWDALQGEYNRHEAEMNRELTRLREKYAALDITKSEDAYIQMLGEFRHNPASKLTLDTVEEYYEKHKSKINVAKVDQIIEMARQDYDDLFKRVNAVLKEQGFKEIPYRKGYFPHFKLEKHGFFAKLFNAKIKDGELPTDIAGLTEQFEPRRSYQSFDKERTSDDTDYSFKKGFDQYSYGALDWVYHIEDLQKRRAVEGYIRYIHSEEGVKAKIDAIKSNEMLDADEAQKAMEGVYDKAKNPLGNLVQDLRRGTQTLAAKKSSLDREMEAASNRRAYSVMTTISNRVSANMVAGSISAALTNFIPITQSWGVVSPISTLGAMPKIIRKTIRNDNLEKSAFLTNRLRKADNLYKSGWDKVSDAASILMTAADTFSAQVIWQSKYDENIQNGMSEAAAIQNADDFAAGLMGDRSRGNMPTIFDSKNPFVKTFTAFQLEVANQYGYLLQDMPIELQNATKGRLVGKYLEVFVGAYVFNSLYKSIVGRNAAFDPIRILQDLVQDIMAAADKDDDEDLKASDVVAHFAGDVFQEIPFLGGFLGGGRMPLSSALPYDDITQFFSGPIKAIEDADEGGLKKLTADWMNPIAYLVMPMAGGQLKKSLQGLSMYWGNKPVSGSYTNKGELRYDLDDGFLRLPSGTEKLLDRFAPEISETVNEKLDDWNEHPAHQFLEDAANVTKSALFGKWSSRNAQEYLEQGRKPLSEKRTEEFVEMDIPIQEYWDIRDGLRKIDNSKSKNKLGEKADYINGLDLSVDQKNILINNIANRKNEIDMTDYDKFGSWAEFDFYTKNPEKHNFLKNNNISYADYAHDPEAYNWAYENPGKYALSATMLIPYTQYYTYRKNINSIEGDKDKNGNTISGSTKKKRLAYINRLPITDYEKAILIKQFYPSDNSNDNMIASYVNASRSLTQSEKFVILYELGLQKYWEGGK